MATRKVETALQELALASVYGDGVKAAKWLRQVPSEYAVRLMEGALRQWAMVVPFVPPAQVEEILGKFGLGIAVTNAVTGTPANETTTEIN